MPVVSSPNPTPKIKKKTLTANEVAVVNRLNDFSSNGLVKADRIAIEGLSTSVVGKVLSNLHRLGYVEKVKEGYTHSWRITPSGADAVESGSINTPEVPARGFSRKQTGAGNDMSVLNPPIPVIGVGDVSIPPTTPDHFVFVVSEQKLSDMLMARFGGNPNETDLLKQRVKLLESTIADMQDSIFELRAKNNQLKGDLEAAFGMAEAAENNLRAINDIINRKA